MRVRYPNFWAFGIVLVSVAAATVSILDGAQALLIGFDLAAIVFIGLTLRTMRGSGLDDIRARAEANDPDHHILLLVALLIVGIILVAVWVELGASTGRGGALALAGGTLLLAWVFSNIMFALHYTHLFYAPGDDGDAGQLGGGGPRDRGGLDFPGEPLPDFGDFAYFAFVLGMTFQVSDVTITAKHVRRLALYHSLAAFLFNIVVVALSVGLIGNLLPPN